MAIDRWEGCERVQVAGAACYHPCPPLHIDPTPGRRSALVCFLHCLWQVHAKGRDGRPSPESLLGAELAWIARLETGCWRLPNPPAASGHPAATKPSGLIAPQRRSARPVATAKPASPRAALGSDASACRRHEPLIKVADEEPRPQMRLRARSLARRLPARLIQADGRNPCSGPRREALV